MKKILMSFVITGMCLSTYTFGKGGSSFSARPLSSSSSSSYRVSSSGSSSRSSNNSSFQQRVNTWSNPAKPVVATTPRPTTPPPTTVRQTTTTRPTTTYTPSQRPVNAVTYNQPTVTSNTKPTSSGLTTGQKVAVAASAGVIGGAVVTQAHANAQHQAYREVDSRPTTVYVNHYTPASAQSERTASEPVAKPKPVNVKTKEQRYAEAVQNAWHPDCNDWSCNN